MGVFSRLVYKDRDFYRNVTAIAVPIALQGLITTGVNMMDTIMVGAVGETELSAVSLANSFINVFQILCMGIGMGASVLVSRYYGMGEQTSLRKAVGIMLRLVLFMIWMGVIEIILVAHPLIQSKGYQLVRHESYLEWMNSEKDGVEKDALFPYLVRRESSCGL